MLPDPTTYDLAELSDRAGVSQRTVRYYIQQGLLPSPETRGPGAHYGPEHLDRLRLIRRLQREHLPLAEIRRRLEALDAAAIRRLVEHSPPPKDDARAYIRGVLSDGSPSSPSPRRVRTRPPPPAVTEAPLSFFEATAPQVLQSPKQAPVRSQWDRIPLGPDVELHVRRPLTREQNRQIERLLQAARHILEEE